MESVGFYCYIVYLYFIYIFSIPFIIYLLCVIIMFFFSSLYHFMLLIVFSTHKKWHTLTTIHWLYSHGVAFYFYGFTYTHKHTHSILCLIKMSTTLFAYIQNRIPKYCPILFSNQDVM